MSEESLTQSQACPHHEVIVVGAGLAGIGAAIKLHQAGMDFLVLEKAAEIGGVWRENTYPNCGCDVPSPLYSYSFAPNPNWQHFFAKQHEIKNYTFETAKQFGVMGAIKCHHEMLKATWCTEKKIWYLHTSKGLYSSRFVIMACGPMHKPTVPKIEGFETFTGTSFHSAQWQHDYDLQNKRVAVIGTGASAIQFVPAIVDQIKQLTLFQRTPPWVLPKMDWRIPSRWQKRFKRFPFILSLLRKVIYLQFEFLNTSLNWPKLRLRLQNGALKNIHRSIKNEDLRAKLTPTFAIGCKRILMSNTWYKALSQEKVVVTNGVQKIRGNSIIASDGTSAEVDAIIFATGFEVANPPIAERIFGSAGISLAEQWQGSPEVYLGTTTKDCPNLFLTFGPNLYTFSSAFVIIEAQLKYIMSALLKVRSKNIKSLQLNEERSTQYNNKVQQALQSTVWNNGGCTSYFIDKTGRNSTNWPWTTFTLRKRLRRFNLKDYNIEKVSP